MRRRSHRVLLGCVSEELLDYLIFSLQKIRILFSELFLSAFKSLCFLILFLQKLLNIFSLFLELAQLFLQITHLCEIWHLNWTFNSPEFPKRPTWRQRRGLISFFPSWPSLLEYSIKIAWNTVWTTLNPWIYTRFNQNRPDFLTTFISRNFFRQVDILSLLLFLWLW